MKKLLVTFLLVVLFVSFVSSVVFAEEPITLTFAAIKFYGEDPMKPLIEKYQQENPNIKINFIQLPSPNNSTEVHQWLVTNLAAKTGDLDVITADCIWFPEFTSAGWLLDVTDKFTPDEQKDYFKGAVETVSYQGKLYGIPWFVDGGLLYYRKDLLEKYGVQPPKTWDELVSSTKKILQGENNPKLKGFLWQAKQAEVLVCDLVEFLGSTGRVLDAKGKVVINNEQGKKTAQLMHDLIFKEQITPEEVNTFDEEPSRTVFTDGNAIYLRNWTYVWNVSQNKDQSSVVDKVGIVPMPAFSGAASASCLGGYQWGISSASKHPEEAVKFAQFLSSYDSQKFFAKVLSLTPTRPKVYEDTEIAKTNPFLVSLKDVFVGTTPRPITPVYPEVSLALQSSFSKICSTKDIDVNAELDTLAKQIEDIVAQK
ncbi:MAG: ABC transporter substrate-binding protein [Candidatus Atribacteria bacterium]|nr:ABC transporter substrate-binding protein [Candidatus Atribacteria bacterium]